MLSPMTNVPETATFVITALLLISPANSPNMDPGLLDAASKLKVIFSNVIFSNTAVAVIRPNKP